jgi:RNA polymerase sigma-70 factor (ECF subfamily)
MAIEDLQNGMIGEQFRLSRRPSGGWNESSAGFTISDEDLDPMAVGLAVNAPQGELDDRLAMRCRAGDNSAFDELVARYEQRLFRFAWRLLNDRTEAEDAVQETFLRVYRALGGYRPDGFFSSWIYRIALNECRRRLRSRKTTVPIEDVPHLYGGREPEHSTLQKERNRRLRIAINELPDHYRDVMVLFYFEDMSVEAVGKALGLGVSAVKVRLHRARGRLATRLEADLR